jgi:hypothetical protein
MKFALTLPIDIADNIETSHWCRPTPSLPNASKKMLYVSNPTFQQVSRESRSGRARGKNIWGAGGLPKRERMYLQN